MAKGAGILFVSMGGNALFLRRSKTAKHPGLWDLPGGHTDDGETPEETAVREAREEIGALPEGERVYHTRQRRPDLDDPGIETGPPLVPQPMPADDPHPVIDYTTYLQKVTNEFVPDLGDQDEHDGFAWSPLDAPPEPLHPGCRVALARFAMDEVGVARAIAAGQLTSPQRYENVWLFAIRITGTGVAYRNTLDEFVHRAPERYLNEEFLARCNGLPVIWRQRSGKEGGFHPSGAILNSDEFSDRVVGTIFLPYIAGDEVWGIAKIYDDAAAQAMDERQLSTSPSVFFRDLSVNTKMEVELKDGSTHPLLIEGKPKVLDHVAVCEQGVWDKGGEPTGVRSESREDSTMPLTPEEQKAADEAKRKADAEAKARADAEGEGDKDKEKEKADAEAGEKLDKTLAGLDAMHKRMDEFERAEKEKADARKARKDAKRARKDAKRKADEDEKRKAGDPEQLAADKAKKDAEDKEKEKADTEAKEKADAEAKAKADAVQARIEEVAKMVKPVADDEHKAIADAWSRADDVFTALGQPTPRHMPGEGSNQYRRRLARELQKHSQTWAKVDLTTAAFADDAAFGIAENQIHTEASRTARSPATVPAGTLRCVSRTVGGHTYNDWVGEPKAWMAPLAGPVQLKATGRFSTNMTQR